jgi:hypothetical protein
MGKKMAKTGMSKVPRPNPEKSVNPDTAIATVGRTINGATTLEFIAISSSIGIQYRRSISISDIIRNRFSDVKSLGEIKLEWNEDLAVFTKLILRAEHHLNVAVNCFGQWFVLWAVGGWFEPRSRFSGEI